MKRIPDLDSREAKGTTTMLFSFEEWDAKDFIVRRRAQRPRRDIDLDKFSQVLRGSASDDFIAEASYFVFNSLFYGEPVQLLEKMFGVFCSTRFKDEFSCRVLYLYTNTHARTHARTHTHTHTESYIRAMGLKKSCCF